MRIESLSHDGRGYTMMTADELLEAGVPAEVVKAAVEKAQQIAERDEARARITANVGDIPSLLGTTADVAALALLGVMQLLIAVAEKGSSDLKAALSSSPIPMPIDKAKALLAAIAGGQVKVPALVKGIDAVYADVAARATATADALTKPKD